MANAPLKSRVGPTSVASGEAEVKPTPEEAQKEFERVGKPLCSCEGGWSVRGYHAAGCYSHRRQRVGGGVGGTRLLCVQNKNVGQVVSSESGAGWNRKRLSGFCPVGNEQQHC